MARVYGIKKLLEQNDIDKKLIKEIIGNGDLVDIVLRMEELLTNDMMCQILDSCACGGGKDYIKKCEKLGKELSGKLLSEKINHLMMNPDSDHVILNEDNTLTVSWHFKEADKYKCVCSAAIKNGIKVSDLAIQKDNCNDRTMPLSYCVCCAGAYRRHLQLQLGVNLRTKEIITSPINSKGEKPCEFTLEIVD